MKKILLALLLIGGSISSLQSQDLKGMMDLRLSSGLIRVNQLPVYNKYFGFEYNSMIPGPIVNFGFKYFTGGSLSNEFEFVSFQNNGNGTFERQESTMSVSYLNYGAGITCNKYLIGNYFDGGLYTNLELSLDMAHVFGNNSVQVSETVPDSLSTGENFHLYSNSEGHLAITLGAKVGYTLPLNNSNIGFFLHLDHSIWGKRMDGYYDEKELKMRRHLISVGISFSFFTNRSFR